MYNQNVTCFFAYSTQDSISEYEFLLTLDSHHYFEKE